MTSPEPGAVLWEALRFRLSFVSNLDLWADVPFERLPEGHQQYLRRVAGAVLDAMAHEEDKP
jgi:hypothetical protein